MQTLFSDFSDLWRNSVLNWRNPLRELLTRVPVARPPALRRSLKPDWLYAVDLPRCASPEACGAFTAAAAAAGWEALPEEAGWIQLRRRDAGLPENWISMLPDSGEAGCLRSLSARHLFLFPDRIESILLLKAEETGPAALEAACRAVHQRWAVLLREKKVPQPSDG